MYCQRQLAASAGNDRKSNETELHPKVERYAPLCARIVSGDSPPPLGMTRGSKDTARCLDNSAQAGGLDGVSGTAQVGNGSTGQDLVVHIEDQAC